VTVASSTAVLIGSGVSPTADGSTVVRLRGELLLFLTGANSNLEGFTGAFGIGICNLPAFIAGIGSVPTPITEEDDNNWLYHRYLSITAAGVIDGTASTDQDAISSVSGALRIEVDSKAMRKMDTDKSLYAAIEVAEVGTATLQVFFNSRVLVKLS